MKNTMKKLLSLLLVLTMTVGIAPVNADLSDLFSVQASAETYGGKCGDNVEWSLDTETGVLNITGTGDMYDYTLKWSDEGAWKVTTSPWDNETIPVHVSKVNIADGITSIGSYAFYGCDSISTVIIPSSVRSVGKRAFHNIWKSSIKVDPDSEYFCTDENGILYSKDKTVLVKAPTDMEGHYDVPEGVVTIVDYAFRGTYITSITIPSTVASIGELALPMPDLSYCTITVDEDNPYYCSKGTSLFNKNKTKLIKVLGTNGPFYTVPDSVTEICDHAFRGCFDLYSITTSDSVTKIGDYAFVGCEGLREIIISAGVTEIGYNAFDDCWNLETVTVEPGNAYYCNDEYGVLFNKDKTNLIVSPRSIEGDYVIPDSVITIETNAFDDCNYLTSVTIPESVTYIGEYAFCKGYYLTDIYYGGSAEDWDAVSIDVGNGVFKTVNIHFGKVITYFSGDFEYSIYKNEATIVGYTGEDNDLVIPSTLDGYPVTKIGNEVFSGCEFSSVSIPDGVTDIGSKAFYQCYSLKIVTVPDSVKNIGENAFAECDYILKVNYSGSEAEWNAVSFNNGNGYLTNASIVFGEVVTCVSGDFVYTSYNNKATIVDYTGSDKYLIIPSQLDGITVAKIGHEAFYGCTELESVVIPDTVKDIGLYSFYGCTGLKEVSYPASARVKHGSLAFYNCNNIEKFVITGNGDIQDFGEIAGEFGVPGYDESPWCQSGCGEVVIEEGVTDIGDFAFGGCENLSTITLPKSLTSISSDAFMGCGLADVYYNGNEYDWNKLYVDEYCFGEATIHFLGKQYYTLNYDANGGSGAPGSQSGNSSYTISSTIPVKDGYNFVGWSLDSNATSASYYAGDTISLDSETTLYAVWGQKAPIISVAFTSDKDVVEPGDTVTYTVKFSGDENLYRTIFVFELLFPEGVTYVPGSAKINEDLGDFQEYSFTENSKVFMLWDEYGDMDLTKENLILTFQCVVDEDAPAGEYSIDFYDWQLGVNEVDRLLTEDEYSLKVDEFMVIDNHSHSYNSSVTKEPTCIEKGIIEYRCSGCGSSYIEEIPVSDHTPGDSDIIHVVDPSCTEGGYGELVVYCETCNEEMHREEIPLAPLGHNYIEREVFEPTCIEKGGTIYECVFCQDSYIEDTGEYADHQWSDWEIMTEPTDFEDGLKVKACSYCGKISEEEIMPKTGITITLADSYGNVVGETIVESDTTEIDFEDVQDGEYTVTVSQVNRVTRTYSVSSSDSLVSSEIKLNYIGDINGDDKITVRDYAQVLKHVKKTTSLEGYSYDCGDVDGNGKLTVADYAKVLRHVKKTESLWK